MEILKILLFGLFILVSVPISAKDLNVATSCDELTCTLSPVSLPQLFKFTDNKGNALKIFETYTPVLVTITNNLNHDVHLNQDFYLHGLEEVFIPSDVFVETIIHSPDVKKIIWNTFWGLFLGYGAYTCGKKALISAKYSNEPVPFLINYLITAIIGHWSLKNLSQLWELLTKGNPYEIKIFHHTESNVVKAQDTFIDLFFIKRSALTGNFWEKTMVKLNYDNHSL